MSKTRKQITQKEAFGQQLKALKGEITVKDRSDYIKKYKCAHSTVSGYLNGTVHDLDTAAQMLSFFLPRIEKRKKLLAITV